MLVAVAFAYGLDLAGDARWPGQGGWPDLAIFVVLVVLVLGSRDTLRKYYGRTGALLTPAARRRPARARRTV